MPQPPLKAAPQKPRSDGEHMLGQKLVAIIQLLDDHKKLYQTALSVFGANVENRVAQDARPSGPYAEQLEIKHLANVILDHEIADIESQGNLYAPATNPGKAGFALSLAVPTSDSSVTPPAPQRPPQRQFSGALRAGATGMGTESDAIKALPSHKHAFVHTLRTPPANQFATRCLFEQVVLGVKFDLFFATLILLNTVALCGDAELRGRDTGLDLGFRGSRQKDVEVTDVFRMIEWVFCSLFTAEVIAKLAAMRLEFFTSLWELFDLTIVGVAWVNLLTENFELILDPMLMRLARLARLVRLARALKSFEAFDPLHLMIRSVKASVHVLVWVIVLLAPLLTATALLFYYQLEDFIKDESKPMASRIRCFELFGTFSRSFLSVFVMTFSNWTPLCRFLVDNVSEWYGLVFCLYVLGVGLCLLRVVYGVFLSVTLVCANSDDETVVEKKRRETKNYAEKMHELFVEMDVSNDGFLTREEFDELTNEPRVQQWLAAMDLEIRDARFVFDLLDDGDEKMSTRELVYGFSRLRGVARSIDLMSLIHLTRKSLARVEELYQKMLLQAQ